MQGTDFIPLLGLTLDDDKIETFLSNCGITKRPKLARGDFTAIVENRKLGLEITFRDERFLDVKSDKYEDGALVLSNVRMYGDGYQTFKQFAGELPYGVKFGSTRKEAEKKLGKKPAWVNTDSNHTRWDFPNHCLFLRFGESNELGEVAVQLPLK